MSDMFRHNIKMLCIFTALRSLSIGDNSKLFTTPCNIIPTRNSILRQYPSFYILAPLSPFTTSFAETIRTNARSDCSYLRSSCIPPLPDTSPVWKPPSPTLEPCPLLWLSKNVGVFIKELNRAIQQTLPWYSKETVAWMLDSGCAKFKIWSKFRYIYFFYNSSGDLYWSKSYGDIKRSGEQVKQKRDLGTNQTHKVPNNYASPVRNVKYKNDKQQKGILETSEQQWHTDWHFINSVINTATVTYLSLGHTTQRGR